MTETNPAPARPAGAKNTSRLLPRLSVPMTADKSRLAVEAMTDPVKERLRAVLADPELRAKLQLPDDRPPAGASPELAGMPVEWDGQFSGILADAVSKVLMLLARQRGYTAAEVEELAFTAGEKSQLAGPTAAVLNKYFPGGPSRWGPELLLLATVAVIVQPKLAAMNARAAERGGAAPGGTVHPFPPPAAASSVQ